MTIKIGKSVFNKSNVYFRVLFTYIMYMTKF